MSRFDPKKHHPPSLKLRRAGRRSIRLKGHDYAGGGLYFVTLCAHREFIDWANGEPFGANWAVGAAKMPPEQPPERVPPMRELMMEEMQKTDRLLPWMSWGEWVIMPDHFHALIRIEGGYGSLGDVMTGFKAGVTRTLRRRGDIFVAQNGRAVPEKMRIWHRNYYERIVRSKEAEEKIAEYIRMNPWRCVQELSVGSENGDAVLRGMGNPALWNAEKLGVLCSRKDDTNIAPTAIPGASVYLSGFHSPMEKEVFIRLLEHRRRIIWCPAWGLETSAFVPGVREALEQNRMLILEMRDTDGTLAAAEARNRFVIQHADKLFIPHKTPGGMLDRLLRETNQ